MSIPRDIIFDDVSSVVCRKEVGEQMYACMLTPKHVFSTMKRDVRVKHVVSAVFDGARTDVSIEPESLEMLKPNDLIYAFNTHADKKMECHLSIFMENLYELQCEIKDRGAGLPPSTLEMRIDIERIESPKEKKNREFFQKLLEGEGTFEIKEGDIEEDENDTNGFGD